MGSRTKTQGVGVRPSLLGRSDLLPFLDGALDLTKSIRYAIEVQPLGQGKDLVKNQCNEQLYPVANLTGRTFLPGDTVALGSAGGGAGDFILGGGPIGRGTSAFPAVETRRTLVHSINDPEIPEVEPACPVLITGRQYLGIFVDKPAKDLHAWAYSDGDYVEYAGPVTDYTGLCSIDSFMGLQPVQLVRQAVDDEAVEYVIFKANAPTTSRPVIVSWNVTDGTLAVLEPYAGSQTTGHRLSGPVWPGSGSRYYFLDVVSSGGTVSIQLRSASFTSVGTAYADEGDPFADASGLITIGSSNGNTILATESDIQAPLTKTGGSIIPYFNFGTGEWSAAVVRGPVQPESEWPTGYPISGGRSLGKIPNPFWGSHYLAAAGPEPSRTIKLPDGRYISVNAAGSEFAVYPTAGEVAELFRGLVPNEDSDWTECEFTPHITVEPGPTADQPFYMLCRD